MQGEGAGRGQGESHNFSCHCHSLPGPHCWAALANAWDLQQPEGVICTTCSDLKYPSGIPLTEGLSQPLRSFAGPQICSLGWWGWGRTRGRCLQRQIPCQLNTFTHCSLPEGLGSTAPQDSDDSEQVYAEQRAGICCHSTLTTTLWDRWWWWLLLLSSPFRHGETEPRERKWLTQDRSYVQFALPSLITSFMNRDDNAEELVSISVLKRPTPFAQG